MLGRHNLTEAAKAVRALRRGGGPALVRLLRVEEPEGLVVTHSRVVVEIESRDGEKTRIAPDVPVPAPYAWALRIARHLGVPLVSSLSPEDLSFEVPLRGR